VLIVTDGAVDLPETLMTSELVLRVPGTVLTGDGPFAGSAAEFWALLRKGTDPSTMPPTVSELQAAYTHPDLVIALHVSGQLSATLTRAQEAAQRVGGAVRVIDSRSLSVGAGLLVTAVHRMAVNPDPSGSSPWEFAQSLPERLHTFALVQEVESLRQSNRAGLIPTTHLVRNHPLVLAVRGRVVPLSQPRHRHAALDDLVRHVRASTGATPGGWALGHGDAADVDAVVDRFEQALGVPARFYTQLDPTVGAHLGPDAIVVGAISGPLDLQD